MPVMDGIEATKKIRLYYTQQRLPTQPKIFGLTGHVQEKYQQLGMDAGRDYILGKPLYSDALEGLLKRFDVI